MAQIAAEKENKDQVIEVTFKQQRQWEPALRSYYTRKGINLESNEEDIKNLVDAKAIVLPFPTIQIQIEYPVEHPFSVKLEADTKEGFTRAGLARLIAQTYQRIYKEDDEDHRLSRFYVLMYFFLHFLKLCVMDERRHGITLHELEELILVKVLYKNGVATLDVDS